MNLKNSVLNSYLRDNILNRDSLNKVLIGNTKSFRTESFDWNKKSVHAFLLYYTN